MYLVEINQKKKRSKKRKKKVKETEREREKRNEGTQIDSRDSCWRKSNTLLYIVLAAV